MDLATTVDLSATVDLSEGPWFRAARSPQATLSPLTVPSAPPRATLAPLTAPSAPLTVPFPQWNRRNQRDRRAEDEDLMGEALELIKGLYRELETLRVDSARSGRRQFLLGLALSVPIGLLGSTLAWLLGIS